MKNGHDRFEALAGAIALGEATPDERERFVVHSRACTACAADVASLAIVPALVERARESESWRPALREAVFARIHERRGLASRFAIGALGWAFAGSVLFNAAVVSGVASHIDRALRDRIPVSEVVATRIEFERRPPATVPTPVPAYVAPRPRPRAVARKPLSVHVARVAPQRKPPHRTASNVAHVAPASARPLESGVDDLLAGLDLASGHGLAAATALHCPQNTDAFASHEPCRTNHDEAQP